MTDAAPVYRHFEAAGWRGVLRDGASWWIGADPIVRLAGLPNEPIKDQPGVRTLRAQAPDGAVYVRHMTALKARRSGRVAMSERFKWWSRPSRALRTMRVHLALAEAGIPVAGVVLAARRRTGLNVEDLLITDEVDGVDFRVRCKAEDDAETEADLLRRAGRAIAELHRAGFAHGDLIPGNMIIAADGRIVFIDNERTGRPMPSRAGALRRLNLAQMVSRLMPRTPYWMMRAFFDAYYDTLGLDDRARRAEQSMIVRRGRRRRSRIDDDRRRTGRRVKRHRRDPNR